jgi:hypothetical protein
MSARLAVDVRIHACHVSVAVQVCHLYGGVEVAQLVAPSEGLASSSLDERLPVSRPTVPVAEGVHLPERSNVEP